MARKFNKPQLGPVNNNRDENYLKALGVHLRSLRMSKGFSQERLELEANIAAHQISRIERGVISVSAVSVKRIADALKVHPKEIFDFVYDEHSSK